MKKYDENYIGNVKNPSPTKLWFKKAFRHIAVGAVTLGIAVGTIFGFAGCGKTNDPVNPGPGPGSTPEKPPIIVEDPTLNNVTFDEFINDYKEDGVTFFNRYVKPEITKNSTENYESLNFTANIDDQLDHASYAYIEKTGDTSRKFNIVNVSFSNPIELEDIVKDADSNEKTLNVVPIIERTYSFDYDAKVNATKTELKNAVNSKFSGYYSTDYEKGVSRIYKESTNEENIREMSTLQINSDNTVNVFTLRVKDDSGSDADMINCLNDAGLFEQNHRRHLNTSYQLNGDNIMTAPYKLEEYKEDGGHGSEDVYVKDMADLLQNYSSEVQQGLQGVKEKLGQEIKSHLIGFNASKIIDSKWDFVCDEDGNISKINYIINHPNSDKTIFIVSSATPSSPINIKDLNAKNIKDQIIDATNDATYKYEYDFNFTQQNQTQYQDLAKAVFEKVGMADENATYLISDLSYTTDTELKEVQDVTFVQITKNGIKEVTARIKDGDLLSNVQNNLYRKTGEKSYNLGGTTLNEEKTNTIAQTHSYYNEISGKYNIADFGDELLF